MEWLDDIDLEPGAPWLRMGTRNLGSRAWLVIDDRAESELWLRQRLISDIPDQVVAEPAIAEVPIAELFQIVQAEGVELAQDASPLQRIGVSIQEDVCLLQPVAGRWVLRAAVLCFPSRWRLTDKLNRPLEAVHGPVEGYAESLGERVDRLIAGLGDRIVLRRNWFVHPDPALHQPDEPEFEPVVAADHCRDDLFLRSERQTLRLLPRSGWCVFTIRIQHCSLGQLLRRREDEFTAWLAESTPDDVHHRGISPEQSSQLRLALEP